MTLRLIVLVYFSRPVLLNTPLTKKEIEMLHLRQQTLLAQRLRILLEVGPDHRLCFPNLATPEPKGLHETKLFEPTRRIETGHDFLHSLIRDTTHFRISEKDAIQSCVGPFRIIEMFEHVYNLGFSGIEIAFFTHVFIHTRTYDFLVPVVDKEQKINLVSLSAQWPSYRKVIVLKTD